MATVKAVVLPHSKKKDGSFNVKIRVTLNRKSSYIRTQHFLEQSQINKDGTVKDEFLLSIISPVILEYRKKISGLGEKLRFYDAKSLADYLSKPESTEINIIEFGLKRIGYLEEAGRMGSRNDMKKVVNSLRDYFKSDFVAITEINVNMLYEYELFLRSRRTMTRPNQFGDMVEIKSKGLSDMGLYNHMRDLRILFNDAVEYYNDNKLGEVVIKHKPFQNYKVVAPLPKNKPKLTINDLRRIRGLSVESGSRAEQAKELFMLSFYLRGMNPVDLFKLDRTNLSESTGRLDYYRSKTKGRRRDGAFISLLIPEVATALFGKYIGKLGARYSSSDNFNRALSFGMREIGDELKMENLQFYDARHAFADIARNECGFSKDDVAMALNVKDSSSPAADIYLRKDWSRIDRLQRTVIELLEEKNVQGFCNEICFSLTSTGSNR